MLKIWTSFKRNIFSVRFLISAKLQSVYIYYLIKFVQKSIQLIFSEKFSLIEEKI